MRYVRTSLAALLVVIALTSLPISIWVSGRYRNAQSHELCIYTQRQWEAGHATILRFTDPGSDARHDALEIAGPRPKCG